MNAKNSQKEHLIRISELITLRDDILNAERALAGIANKRGFEMGVQERRLRGQNKFEWVHACLNPVSLLTKSLTAVLEHYRKQKTVTPSSKKLLKVTEKLVFWGSVLHGLTKVALATTPIGALLQVADVEASLVLKAMELRKLERIEALAEAMDNFWNASLEFKKLSPVVVGELNREIDRWQS